MTDLFDRKLADKIVAVEGGYSNDPSDSGDETMFGITERVARRNGYAGPMAAMPRSTAVSIYRSEYWTGPGFADVAQRSERIAEELFDTGVNLGVGRAALFLQMALNALNNGGVLYADIGEDMDIGGKTLAALDRYLARRPGAAGVEVMIRVLDSLQGAFYVDLARRRGKDEKYVYGWFANRVGNA